MRARSQRGRDQTEPRAPRNQDRAIELLVRLEQAGPAPQRAAEELDRQIAGLRETAIWPELELRIGALCDRWAETELRGDGARAWLTLVGALGLGEHEATAAVLLSDPAIEVGIRQQAARVLGVLRGPLAGSALAGVLRAPGDPRVRAAAAEALAQLRDRTWRPTLEALLEEDLPASVWNAVSATLERL